MGQRLLIRVHPCLSVVEFLGLQLAALGSLPRQGLWQGNQTDRVPVPISLPNISLPFGATQRAHLTILAQTAEFVQAMVAPFFITRNPCKH